MRSPVVLATVVVVAAATATAASLATGDTDAGPASVRTPPTATTSSATTPTLPAVLSGCSVAGPQGNISLTTAQAEDLTSRAVIAVRQEQSPTTFTATVSRVLQISPTNAAVVARSLLAAPRSARLACSVTRAEVDPEKMGRNGLTPRAQRLRRAWTDVFGALPAGGFASGGVRTGHVDNSAHYDGRAIDVFFRPLNSAAQRRLGWVFAQWAVAHAERHHILSVIYADHIWTSWASTLGFRDYQHPGGPTTNAVLRHLDHVHVAIESGRPFWPR